MVSVIGHVGTRIVNMRGKPAYRPTRLIAIAGLHHVVPRNIQTFLIIGLQRGNAVMFLKEVQVHPQVHHPVLKEDLKLVVADVCFLDRRVVTAMITPVALDIHVVGIIVVPLMKDVHALGRVVPVQPQVHQAVRVKVRVRHVHQLMNVLPDMRVFTISAKSGTRAL